MQDKKQDCGTPPARELLNQLGIHTLEEFLRRGQAAQEAVQRARIEALRILTSPAPQRPQRRRRRRNESN